MPTRDRKGNRKVADKKPPAKAGNTNPATNPAGTPIIPDAGPNASDVSMPTSTPVNPVPPDSKAAKETSDEVNKNIILREGESRAAGTDGHLADEADKERKEHFNVDDFLPAGAKSAEEQAKEDPAEQKKITKELAKNEAEQEEGKKAKSHPDFLPDGRPWFPGARVDPRDEAYVRPLTDTYAPQIGSLERSAYQSTQGMAPSPEFVGAAERNAKPAKEE